MSKEICDNRKEEIINACERLYEKKSFKEITIKSIGKETTFSRPSIYNYFETKEEIFLAILQKEYEKWILELEQMQHSYETMTKKQFAENMAHSIEKRQKLLKLLSMNLYDIEENSRMELLIKFKQVYGKAIRTIKSCLDKFFKDMQEEEKINFLYSFLPFMYGIYPYAVVTEKQKEAMEQANVNYKYMSIYEITYNGIINLFK